MHICLYICHTMSDRNGEFKTVIDAKKSYKLNLKELWDYKDLFRTLAWRDFKVRYAQTAVGLLWAIIQPLATIGILYLVFARFAKIPMNGIPPLVFIVCGMSLWSFFAYVMSNSGSSIIQSQSMISKIYFPRLIIPISKSVVGLIDLIINLCVLIVLMLVYQISPSSNLIFAPLFIIMGVLSALGVGIWLSALSIKYRDFQHIIPFMVQIGLYITPIAYPAQFAIDNLPSSLSTLYFLNPMAGVIQGFRWSVLGGSPPGNLTYISLAVVVLIFVTGLYYFRSVESKMADIV